jgi:membrane-bound serine protease (ClpP class)
LDEKLMNSKTQEIRTRLGISLRARWWPVAAVVWLVTLFYFITPRPALAQDVAPVYVGQINGVIDTFTSGYIDRVLGAAKSDGAQLVVFTMDTPGGDLDATYSIGESFLASPVPIAVYVSPAGARAASAGTFITYASTIAAMAPGTNIGAAHPVDGSGGDITGTLGVKVVNDAVAHIQNYAEQRGRNPDWAASAVTQSVSITAKQALDLHVINLIASNQADLLNQLDGRAVTQNGQELRLHTRGAPVREFDMTIIEEFFHVLLDPNIAAILLSIGSLAILVELYNPGSMIPAIVGVICLTLGAVALYGLPTNWAAVFLMAAAIVMFVIDVKVNSIVLTIGAIITFALGAAFLFRPLTPPSPTAPEIAVSPFVIAGLVVLMAAFFLVLIRAVVRSRLLPVVSGITPFLGASGVATSELNPVGTVRVRSEDWTATAEHPPIHKGEPVKVVAVEGLRMRVDRS